ncbi:MmgE/PrpD family protein [Streptomyces iconiensis]|uniref:MmgE/PrpD family protein n=1 Tax=Streptomyces iconiensis TaxID=1384038 RepID=A0ABT7A3D8_9ACTN|nr:MmgE/PrpD family protein [Streptomyces iconiensis]MDJ1135801.1 MmgE/PrpD family protein [Streptomyces iconiensis]
MPEPALGELAGWASQVRPEAVPERVLSLAASQVLSQAAAIRTGAGHELGRRMTRAFGPPLQSDTCRSAAVLAGLGSWLNLDDTAYAGHLSNSTVAVPLAYAYAHRLDGLSLLTAVVVANECAARVTASATLGPLRGQSAVHTHLVGATAARLHCEQASGTVWRDALGLALGMPNWPLMRAFLASDARLLNALTPVRTAMDACDAAYAGLHGAPDLVEHPDGFLARFADVPLPEAVTAGLGRRWHTETLSFKMHPGGPGVDAAVDCAARIHDEVLARPDAGQPEEVVVEASLYTLFAGQKAAPYVTGPGSPQGALVLDTPYAVAVTLLNGRFTPDDLASPALDEPRRWDLAKRVRLTHDPAMTRDLLCSEAPFGEALRQAGSAAEPWLRSFGGDALVRQAAAQERSVRGDFRRAEKATGARVTVLMADGRTVVREQRVPEGGAGPDTRMRHARLVRQKFRALGGPAWVAGQAPRMHRMSARELRQWIEAALGNDPYGAAP